jgi:hypothetical protein
VSLAAAGKASYTRSFAAVLDVWLCGRAGAVGR